ncbi:MAG: hypothetical protein AABZ16_09535 [candidate division NC10 bacterium]
MEKRTELFVNSYLYPVLVPLTVALGTMLLSKFATGDWLKYVHSIPKYAWVVMLAALGLWVAIVAVSRRFGRLREENARRGPLCFSVPPFGYQEITEFPFKGVLWPVEVPAPPPWQLTGGNPCDPSEIEVGTPPRCPKCKTELEEQKTFLGQA